MESGFIKKKNGLLVVGTIMTTIVIAIAILGTVGTTSEYRGWVSPPVNPSETRDQYSYFAKLESDQVIFRGSDLFRVTTPRIMPTDGLTIAQQWDSRHVKGRVQFTSSRPLPADARLPVSYRLTFRWEKMVPFAATLLAILLSLWFYGRIAADPEILSNQRLATRFRMGLLLIFAVCSWRVLSCSGWAYGDTHSILLSTVRGEFLTPRIFSEVGRFFPLGQIDLNLLIPFGDSPFAYQVERTILMSLMVSTTYLIVTRIAGAVIGSLLVIVFLTTPDLFRVYSDTIFPEALLLVLLALFFWCYLKGCQTNNGWYFIASCLLAGLATYCKEPVFGMLTVFALVQLFFGYRELSRTRFAVNIFLLVNAVVFLGVYSWFCAGQGNYAEMQNEGMGRTRLSVLLEFCRHPAVTLSFGWGAWRSFQLLVRRDRTVLIYDAILFSGLAYTVAFVLLRLSGDYYLTPAYVCWTIASAGYLARLNASIDRDMIADKSHREKDNFTKSFRAGSFSRQRVSAFSILVCLIVGCVQLAATTHCIRNTILTRSETHVLAKLFVDLEDHGYQLYCYYPNEMQGHPHNVQRWRQDVINIFNDNLRNTSTSKGKPDGPVRSLTDDELALLSDKVVVILDSNYSHAELNQSRSDHQVFRRVDAAPLVMGASLYAPDSQLDEIDQLLPKLSGR